MSDYIVWFKKEAFDLLYNEAMEGYPLETGGVFIGYHTSKIESVVTHVIGPGPDALHLTDSFIPDQTFHEEELSNHFHNTNGMEVYLGDWHTHPKDDVYLSRLDKKTLKKIAKFKDSRLENPFMGVFGSENEEFKIWKYIPSKISFLDFKISVQECLVKFY